MRHALKLAILAIALVLGGIASAENKKPNILFILADDLGYGDVGFCPIPATNVLARLKTARFFAGEGWLVGASVDGPPCVHDTHRRFASGGGSYSAVMRGISRLSGAGAEFNVLCLVTPENVSVPAQVYRHLRECGFTTVSPPL